MPSQSRCDSENYRVYLAKLLQSSTSVLQVLYAVVNDLFSLSDWPGKYICVTSSTKPRCHDFKMNMRRTFPTGTSGVTAGHDRTKTKRAL